MKRLLSFLILMVIWLFYPLKQFYFNHFSSPQPQILSHTLIPSPWMHDQINKNLDDADTCPDSQQNLYASLKNQYQLMLIKIQDGHLSFETNTPSSPRFLAMKEGIEKLVKIDSLPNLVFVISLEDLIEENLPIGVFARKEENIKNILIPDFSCFAKKPSSYAFSDQLYERLTKIKTPFLQRKPLAFWRGSKIPNRKMRDELVHLARLHPEYLDAKFVYSLKDLLKLKAIWPGSFFSPVEQCTYRYLIDLDGVTVSFPGFYWKLLSNSLVLKQTTTHQQWFHSALQDGKHYLSFTNANDSLIDLILWCNDHPQEVETIASNGKAFVEKELNLSKIYSYYSLLFHELSNRSP